MRVALVTGASRGIGLAIATRFKTDGYEVLTPTRAELDLSNQASIEEFLRTRKQDIDILVNDAGINRVALLDKIQSADLEATLQISLLAPFRLIQALTPGMCARGYGRIVNISSIWSMVSRAGRTTYTISKTALNGMTRSLAIELASYNVMINAVAPGYVLTDLTRQNNSPEEIERISQTIPAHRMAAPEEIANVVSFLCSEQNSYMTGQTVLVDGGYSCL
jgi:3-oxoacyl-[acyl-carrier protein] reductase